MTMEKFHYTTPTGEIALPRVTQIPSGLIRKYRKLEEMDMLFSILEDLVDEETLSKIDSLEQGQLEDFVTKWQEGSPMGESSGSLI